MRLMFDIEGDAYLSTIKKVWCIATEDCDTGEKNFYDPTSLDEGIVALRAAETLVGHNIIVYDLPAMWKVLGDWEKPIPYVLDTLVLSYYLQPERKGGHSLEAWGERVGEAKMDFGSDFSRYTERMGYYCRQDVTVNIKVLQALEKEHGATITKGFKVFT